MFLQRDQRSWLPLLLCCWLMAATVAPLPAQTARRQAAPSEGGHASRQDGRMRPPAAITCDRNNLTVYAGKVLSYTRRADRIRLRIYTDSDTTETVTLRYTRGGSPLRWFLLNGERFEPGDWSKIESSRGKLYPGMRVSAWVCTDGRRPVLDWQPPADDNPNPPRSTP